MFICVCIFLSTSIVTAGLSNNNLYSIADSLEAWEDSVVDAGDIKNLRKSLETGSLYDSAYAMAQYQVVRPALDSLDLTHKRIAQRCDNKLAKNDVITVFSYMPYGQNLDAMMGSRGIIDSSQAGNFAESCVAVYKCYFQEDLIRQQVDLDEFTVEQYSSATMQGCSDVVTREYDYVYQSVHSQEIARNMNYGDEIFFNGTLDDSPFDILVTIKEIGDILFYNNDEPTQISYYENNQFKFYESTERNNPSEEKSVVTQDPSQETREERIGITGVTQPREITGQYNPTDEPPAGWGPERTNQSTITPPGGNTISQPIMCMPEEEDIQLDDILSEGEAAEREREATYDRNTLLDLETMVAVELGSRVSPEFEESFGEGMDRQILSELQIGELATIIFNETAELGADEYENFIDHIKGCVEEFTDGDKGTWQKTLWKSITQPTAFTQCVMQGMCEEKGDTSMLGQFRVKICKIPTLATANVSSDKNVDSVEEVVDELLNVCRSLRDSGQLGKHNKTKGHWTHKLMNLQRGDWFSFGISVSTATPPASQNDLANEKIKTVEKHRFIENYTLGFNDDITFQEEKNKYLLIAEPLKSTLQQGLPSDTVAAIEADIKRRHTEIDRSGHNRYLQENQMQIYNQGAELLDIFVRQNSLYRIFVGEHTQTMQKTWSATYEEFKNASGD